MLSNCPTSMISGFWVWRFLKKICWLMIFFLKKKSVNIWLLFFLFFDPLGTVIVKMKLDVQYSEKVFLGNFQYSNQKQTGDNRERELVSVHYYVTWYIMSRCLNCHVYFLIDNSIAQCRNDIRVTFATFFWLLLFSSF